MLVAVVAYCVVLGAIAATAVAATKGKSEARKRNISANGQVRQPSDPHFDTPVPVCLPGLWDMSPLHEGVVSLTEGPPCVMYITGHAPMCRECPVVNLIVVSWY